MHASLLGNKLAGIGVIKAGDGATQVLSPVCLTGKGKTRRGEKMFILPHPLSSFEIQRYYQNKHQFHGVYSRKNLPNIVKDGKYVINLDMVIQNVLDCLLLQK